jgi:hypothetical protein
VKAPKPLNELMMSKSGKNKLHFYQQQSESLNKVRSLITDIIGDNISQNITVSNYKNSSLHLETHSAPIANRLKQLNSQLLSHLRKNFDYGLVAISVKVNPKSTRVVTPVSNKKVEEKVQKEIPESAREMLLKIAEKADGELKRKLQKLAESTENKN